MAGFAEVQQCQCGALHWQPSFIAWTMSDLIVVAPNFTEPSLESAEQHFPLCDVVKTISKNSFGLEDGTLLGDFSAFSSGMMMATLQILGEWARQKDELNMDSNSWTAKRPNDLRKDGGMSSGPTAPLLFIYLMAANDSHIWSGTQLSSSIDGASSCFLKWRLRSQSAFDMLSLLTLE